MKWEELEQRLRIVSQKRERLIGKKQALDLQRAEALDDLQQSQNRVQAGDFVREILDALQKKEHERAVGIYEQLLGAFLSDVLPGERQIVMDLHTERGVPALDVFIKKGDNSPPEDAWLGTGGSVTNLLSTALRLVALLRSGQRRFLVLDESDCWLAPELIPKYAAIVAQMASELNVQVLMISHHDESLFAKHIPHRLQLTQLHSGLLQADWSPTSDIPSWDHDQTGLRSITLSDFQAHQHTVVNLSPGVTLLQGKNDIGKSAVVNALRAVFDGSSNETLIRHHASQAKVLIDLGPDHYLSWQRFRKGKVLVSYKLIDPSTNQTLHATDGTKVPEWVQGDIKIGRIEGLDVQIGQQQDPVFLLNQTASVRAKALAIGQESGHVNNMMLLDRQEVQDAKSVSKHSEKVLEKTRHQVEILNTLHDLPASLDLETLKNNRIQMERLEALAEKWNYFEHQIGALRVLGDKKRFSMPTLRSLHFQELGERWLLAFQRHEALLVLQSGSGKLIFPELRYVEVAQMAGKWIHLQRKFKILSGLSGKRHWTIPQPQASLATGLVGQWKYFMERIQVLAQVGLSKPLLHPQESVACGQLLAIKRSWEQARNTEEAAEYDRQQLVNQYGQLQDELMTTYQTCPTCGQSWEHTHS